MKKAYMYIVAFLMLTLLLACGISLGGVDEEATQMAEMQKTLEGLAIADAEKSEQDGPAVTQTEESEQDEEEGGASPTSTWRVAPCNRAELVSETIPDGTVMSPGQNFTKTWKIKNTGSCTWTGDYRIVFDIGHKMNGFTEKSLSQDVDPQDILTVTANLTANNAEGDYKGTYKIKAPDGTAFIKFWTDVTVELGGFDIEPIEPLPDIPLGRPLTQPLYSEEEFTVENANQTGACPLEFYFKFRFKVEAPGDIYYNFELCNTQSNVCEMVYITDRKMTNFENFIGTYSTIHHTEEIPFTGNYSLKIIVSGQGEKIYGPIELTATCNQ